MSKGFPQAIPSSPVGGVTLRSPAVATQLAELIHSLGLRQAPIVVGHATSAWLATAFARDFAVHAVLTIDAPTTAIAATVDNVINAAGIDQVTEPYRPFARPRRDPALLAAYRSWFDQPTASSKPARSLSTAATAASCHPRSLAESRFAHLSDPQGVAAALRTLM